MILRVKQGTRTAYVPLVLVPQLMIPDSGPIGTLSGNSASLSLKRSDWESIERKLDGCRTTLPVQRASSEVTDAPSEHWEGGLPSCGRTSNIRPRPYAETRPAKYRILDI